MTSLVDRPLVGYRFVETRFGDNLQKIAARELGDASRWPEIVSYNDLVPPFITDDIDQAGVGVILSGEALKVPAPTVIVDASTNPDATFLSDVQLTNGQVEADETGDMLLCQGLPNLRQALIHAVRTERGELIYHASYGCLIKRLIGTVNGPTANIMAAQYAKSTVEADPRIQRVSRSTAQAVGDVINVAVQADAISGRSISFNEGI